MVLIFNCLMAKPSIFVTLPKKWFPFLPSSLEKRFEVEYWKSNNDITKKELIEKVKGKFGIYTISRIIIDEDVIKAAGPSLKVVSIRSAGHENVDVQALKTRGIKIGYLGSVNTEATAEMAVTLLLTVGRRIKRHIMSPGCTMARDDLSFGLHNSIVGIIGCGSIGTSVVRKLKGFNIKRLMYFARSEKPEVKAMGGEFCSLSKIMIESDFVVTTLSLNEETEKIISQKLIYLMKPTAIFVNVGRGAVVDQESLTEALRVKRIAGAGLDVTTPEPLSPEHVLFKMDNVVITPHVAACTVECMKEADELAAENLLAVLDGKEMPMELKVS